MILFNSSLQVTRNPNHYVQMTELPLQLIGSMATTEAFLLVLMK